MKPSICFYDIRYVESQGIVGDDWSMAFRAWQDVDDDGQSLLPSSWCACRYNFKILFYQTISASSIVAPLHWEAISSTRHTFVTIFRSTQNILGKGCENTGI